MKTAIMVLSDPKSGSEQALGSIFNALAVAREHKDAGEQVQVIFAGTGTRWPAELNKTSHPANGIYKSVVDTVAGVSCGCAEVFGAETQGLTQLTGHALPGTPGVVSVLGLQRDGWQVLTF
jgi:hypothetical protein